VKYGKGSRPVIGDEARKPGRRKESLKREPRRFLPEWNHATAAFDMNAFLATIEGGQFSTNQQAACATKYSGPFERTIYSKFLSELKRRLAFNPKFKTYSVSFFPEV
jgi:hypothetical protein